MKIAMITPRYKVDVRGGGELSLQLLVEALRNQGISVVVFSGDKLFPKIKDTLKLNTAMYKYLKKSVIGRYDIYHTYNMSLLPTIGRLTKKYNINSVGTLNGHVFSPTFERRLGKHPVRNYAFAKVILETQIRHIKKFTVLSNYERNTWIDDGIPSDKIQVITNMISEDYKAKECIHNNEVNILVVGNCATWRDLNMILNAYAKLPKQNITLRVVGQGWEEKIKKYSGKNTLLYYPQVEHEKLKDFFSLADIYVQAFSYNGLGRTMLEAAQNKTAIVTTGDVQDFPYIHGFLNYFANSDMLQLTLQTLIKNKNLRDDQGEQVCRVVNKYFSPEATVKKYIKIYEEILKC